jgi:hypothetical protein
VDFININNQINALGNAMVSLAAGVTACIVLQCMVSIYWGRPQVTMTNTEKYYPYCEKCGESPVHEHEEDYDPDIGEGDEWKGN